MTFDLSELNTQQIQYYLNHLVAPRPICLASTIDRNGNVNLSPFSYFNIFSSNPPIVVFSPVYRVRDSSAKDTLQNVKDVPEVVVNIVDASIVEQQSLASCDYPSGMDEFVKAGFNKLPSETIRPPRVRESKAQLECVVKDVIALGEGGGAGHLVLAEVKRIHIDPAVLEKEEWKPGFPKMNQAALKLVARLGASWYCVVDEDNLFKIDKPGTHLGIGFDALPAVIRESRVFTGNQLARLAGVEALPAAAETEWAADEERQRLAAELLDKNEVDAAWQLLMNS